MDDRQPLGSINRLITRQCAATSKRSKQRCREPEMRGRTVCLAHGWHHSRGGVAAFARARADPTLRSLRDERALVDATIADHLH
jgi:hypothetical protein